MSSTTTAQAAVQPNSNRSGRSTLAACGATHALHDGFGDGMLLFLPLWQAEFGLTLAQAGAIRAMYSAASAAFQLPGSFLAERIGGRITLAAGTVLLGLGYVWAALSGSYASLLLGIFVTGVGASVQHALSSSLISHAMQGPRLRVALGTYNFLGDVGKVAVPAIAALVLSVLTWRDVIGGLGVVGIVFAVLIFWLLRNVRDVEAASHGKESAAGERASNWPRFSILALIAFLDSMGRYGALALLPFVLTAKGADITTVGFALSLVFVGGAAGKFACGLVAIRLGVVGTVLTTEIITAVAVVALTMLPLSALMFLLPLLGLTLNGTSSVLYGSVPEVVARPMVARAFGVFYTLVSAGTAVAPFIYGNLSDQFGLDTALRILAACILIVIPLVLSLRVPADRQVAHSA